jgi:radical SAM protein with 4Fe4S-binding SPASM domain
MDELDWKKAYLLLAPRATLVRIEEPSVYLIDRDELYELNDEALGFLGRCDGTSRGEELTDDAEFVSYCVDEGILEASPTPRPRRISVGRSPIPSLRSLELQLTSRCNLRCLHCYQGEPAPVDLPFTAATKIVGEFTGMAGLRLLISGGEPMLYPHLLEFLDEIRYAALHKVLITNGTLIDAAAASRLGVDEVQFSLDGWERGHELIRGTGTFARVMRGIEAARGAGITVSIATMIHAGNLDEFDRMGAFIDDIGASAWGIDLPCVAGRQGDNRPILVSPAEAAPLLRYAFGGGSHAAPGFACGHHLMTVLPTGIGAKCGFYPDDPLGDAVQSLAGCWLSLKHVRADELQCRGCPHLSACGGGCRFRAPGPLSPDPVMCALFGVDRPGPAPR